jgi:hypothetical protein
MAIEFGSTMRGAKFYDADVPRIAKALERIATELEKQNEPPAPPDPQFTDDMVTWVMRFCSLVGEHGTTTASRDEAFARLHDAVRDAKKKE